MALKEKGADALMQRAAPLSGRELYRVLRLLYETRAASSPRSFASVATNVALLQLVAATVASVAGTSVERPSRR
ncbi:MAG: hypothetical protein HZLCBSQH_002248 [Candidatus Fervidibacterota bacterium]